MDAGKRKALARAGAYVRRTAANSIKRARRDSDGSFKPSPPGQPPRSRTGLLKRFLLFSYDDRSDSVVVGPVRISSLSGQAPMLLEFGGTHQPSPQERTRRLRTRRLGDGGEIRIRALTPGAPVPADLAASPRRRQEEEGQRRVARRVRVFGEGGKRTDYEVSYARLRSASQVLRANRINRYLFESRAKAYRFPPRPYMAPALQRSLPHIPKGFRGAVST
jgi:hypothetical protein